MDVEDLIRSNLITENTPKIIVSLVETGTVFGGVVVAMPSEIPVIVVFEGNAGILPSIGDIRITESGDIRITESGDTRILE